MLAQLIELPDYERDRIRKEVSRKRGFVPVTIKENLTWEEMSRIQVNAPDLPGVIVDEGLTRYYPLAGAGSHLLGYVAAVDEADLTGDPLLQLPGFKIGKLGVEKVYDMALRGKGGTSEMEVNAVGRAIRELERHEGEPGADVTLTIDERIQNFAAERLPVEESVFHQRDGHLHRRDAGDGVHAQLRSAYFHARADAGGVERSFHQSALAADQQSHCRPLSARLHVQGLRGFGRA